MAKLINDELVPDSSKEIYRRNIDKIRDRLLEGTLFKGKEILYLKRFYKCCVEKLNADKDKFFDLANLPIYLEQLFNLTCIYADSISKQRKITPNLNQLRQLINQKEQNI